MGPISRERYFFTSWMPVVEVIGSLGTPSVTLHVCGGEMTSLHTFEKIDAGRYGRRGSNTTEPASARQSAKHLRPDLILDGDHLVHRQPGDRRVSPASIRIRRDEL